jgi:endo-1,3-1,4-beta-glycanase ExoK
MYKTISKTSSVFMLVLIVLILLLLPVIASAKIHHTHSVLHWKTVNIYPKNGIIHWKGQTWDLLSGHSNPGNNYWNESGAWIDNQNRLHLSIIKKGGKWYCTGLGSESKYTYGTITWTVASPVHTFDKNSIFGLYTYQDDTHELDIESTRWGHKSGDDSDYSVQPSQNKGNERTYKVTDANNANINYKLEWKPDYVKFSSMQNGKIVNEWKYTQTSGIPKTPENVCMNLWLIKPPSNGKNIECIISNFNITS